MRRRHDRRGRDRHVCELCRSRGLYGNGDVYGSGGAALINPLKAAFLSLTGWRWQVRWQVHYTDTQTDRRAERRLDTLLA